ncbi:hypothetical protein N1851_001392 [Merluccius polli]|uniref:Uncharacterized protein n=1 Tax=Merluccius polli TaxID=89951 RepID=A0AA47NCW4_MERPO|nr:hypothetical protein N1851_001392 [Merluccius polli]
MPKNSLLYLTPWPLATCERAHTHSRPHSGSGVNISSVDVKDLALSDHFCVFFDLQIIPNVQLTSVSVKRRYINENTSAKFMEAIAMSPTVSAESVDELLDKFNWKISNVMDAVAPIKTKMTLIRKKTPWRNTMMVKAFKNRMQDSRVKTKLQIHHDLYKISLCNFNYELLKARQRHFSEIINKNINNTRTLFAMVDKLTTPPKQIAQNSLPQQNAMNLLAFSVKKSSP